jgi:hypothetical protein
MRTLIEPRGTAAAGLSRRAGATPRARRADAHGHGEQAGAARAASVRERPGAPKEAATHRRPEASGR